MDLAAQNVDLKQTIELLLARIQELLLENKELKRKLTELEDKFNINSSNSGLPTSKEIYRVEKRSKPKSDKNPGGQPGHKYNAYKMKIPDRLVEVVSADEVCTCGGNLVLTEEFRLHQKIEIPPIHPVVTEYKLRQKICVICNRKYKARLADNELLGKNAQSIITALSGFFNNSKRDVQSILAQVFNLDISLGLISNTEGRVSARLENKYNELARCIEESSYLHLDETGSNNRGKRHWCFVAASKIATVFKIASSRGKKVLEEFLPEYEGKVISDRYAIYNMFDSQKRQICLAHLRRDFKRFAYSKDRDLAEVGKELLGMIDAVFKYYKLSKAAKLDKFRYLWIMQKIKERMYYYLEAVLNMPERAPAQRVAKNILKSFDMMWLFVNDTEIEPTNNFAERQIKHHVKYRKNSYFTWSKRGDRFLERIKSLYASAKLLALNPFLELSKQLI